MKQTVLNMIGLVVLVHVPEIPAYGQAPSEGLSHDLVASSLRGRIALMETSAGGPVRVIDDPPTRTRWLLMRNPVHPSGPGLLIPSAVPLGQAGLTGCMSSLSVRPRPGSPALPVIHSGDRLIVEENSALVEARLEAVALGSASAGSPLKVRLKIGGVVVRAVALGPGRAAIAPESEARP
jgi:hypothetical protein